MCSFLQLILETVIYSEEVIFMVNSHESILNWLTLNPFRISSDIIQT